MRWGETRTLERCRGWMGLGSEVLPEHMMGKRVPLPTMIFELEGMKELMEERLPDDDERCEDAPESMNQVASGCCRVIVLKALAKAAWFQDAVGSTGAAAEGVT